MRPTIAYQPALDGVRALAVIAVLLFHAGVAGWSGGYLGVSVFFTLSGYLITSLLLHEHATTGRIDLGAFYARRLRRLLPASAACLAAIVLLARLTDLFDGVDGLRDEALGAIMQVANWVFLAGEGSYQDLLAQQAGAVSPLEHFWSLAIEEQFYWVWPPTMALLLAKVASPQRRLRAVAAVSWAAIAAAPLIAWQFGPDAAYWATPARIGEILVGAWVAVALAVRRSAPHPRWALAAPAALLALGVSVATFPADGGPAYHGALPLVALASAALLVGLQVDGVARRALAWAPLVYLGKISYGVYLFHWPIYVLLDEPRLGVGGAGLVAVRLGVTLALAVVSFHAVESPIRHARWPRPVTFGGALAATAAVAMAAVTVVPAGLGEYWRTDDEVAEAAAIDPDDTTALVATEPVVTQPVVTQPVPTQPSTSGRATAPTSSVVVDAPPTVLVPPTVPPLGRPVRVLVVGDSTANALGTGVVNWAAAHPYVAQAEVDAAPGCGFLTGGERLTGQQWRPSTDCDGWTDRVLGEVAELQPDVVVAMVTTWDILDRRWDGDEALTPTAAAYAARLQADYTTLVDGLLESGAGHVALVRHAVPNPLWMNDATAETDTARHAVIYDMYADLSQDRSRVRVVDLAGWMAAAGFDTAAQRPDGIHLDPAAATELMERFLGDELIRVAVGLPGEWSDHA